MQQNIDTTRRDKLVQYQQLGFETKKRRSGYTVTIVTVIIRALGSIMKKTMNELTKLLTKQEPVLKTAAEMHSILILCYTNG